MCDERNGSGSATSDAAAHAKPRRDVPRPARSPIERRSRDASTIRGRRGVSPVSAMTIGARDRFEDHQRRGRVAGKSDDRLCRRRGQDRRLPRLDAHSVHDRAQVRPVARPRAACSRARRPRSRRSRRPRRSVSSAADSAASQRLEFVAERAVAERARAPSAAQRRARARSGSNRGSDRRPGELPGSTSSSPVEMTPKRGRAKTGDLA